VKCKKCGEGKMVPDRQEAVNVNGKVVYITIWKCPHCGYEEQR